ncbi:MAG: ribonuclease III [Thermoflexaceae bacterium]|nr:ribonuclease III [Thermoflexaceae bacterium]
MPNKNLKGLEEKIGYSFRDKDLLRHAMTHSSFANEHRLKKSTCNERLEFLGDAVLEIMVSEYLYHNFPEMPEGEMTKNRASMVCEPALAFCSRDIELGSFLLMGKGEELTGGRGRDSIVSDAMEALIGAIYLDGGFTSAKEFVYQFVLNDVQNKKLFYDSKTILQEMIQAKTKEALMYRLTGESGPDHNKTFEVEAVLGERIIGKGTGKTKKAAEQEAAYRAILAIRRHDKEERKEQS